MQTNPEMFVTVVVHPETKEVYTKTSNEKVFSVRLEQSTLEQNKNFVGERKKVCFINGEREVLDKFYGELKEGDQLKGKIVYEDGLFPPNEKAKPVVNPETNKEMEYKGYPIYRVAWFSKDLSVNDLDTKEQDYQVLISQKYDNF